MTAILDVDLLLFEQGTTAERRAVVDGVRRSLATGFVYTNSDLSSDMLDTAYGMLAEFRAHAPPLPPPEPTNGHGDSVEASLEEFINQANKALTQPPEGWSLSTDELELIEEEVQSRPLLDHELLYESGDYRTRHHPTPF